jgi:hypothetical protein
MSKQFAGSHVANGYFGAADIVAEKLTGARDHANGELCWHWAHTVSMHP